MKHTGITYGYYLGGDPRLFTPDQDSSTEQEMQAWRDACAAWERGEQDDPGPACKPFAGGHVTMSTYGLGVTVTEWDCDGQDFCDICGEKAP